MSNIRQLRAMTIPGQRDNMISIMPIFVDGGKDQHSISKTRDATTPILPVRYAHFYVVFVIGKVSEISYRNSYLEICFLLHSVRQYNRHLLSSRV